MNKKIKSKIKRHIKVEDKIKIISGQNKGNFGVVKKIFKFKKKIIINFTELNLNYLKKNDFLDSSNVSLYKN
uniref:Ribosomal protein L24 n=1 Tax=Phaeophyceae sp. TaxID=2249243 RepID=A0A8E5BF21_9PHAE|nr:ribosomal protein L24 [Phaeophyceae sp.]